MERITIFTPAYNAEKTLYRTFESLKKQSYRNFVWVICNDCSTDNTLDVIHKILEENVDFSIQVINNEYNKGKHISFNDCLSKTQSELIINLDSDDAFTDYALSTLIYYWDLIEDKNKYAGIKSQTISDSKFSRINSVHFNKHRIYIDASLYDFKFKLKLDKGEMHYMMRTDVAKEFETPNIEGLKYYPENIGQMEISKHYMTRFLDIPTRIYYTSSSYLTKKTTNNYEEKRYMHLYFVNELKKLKVDSFPFYLKMVIGYIRDNKKCDIGFRKSLKEIKRFWDRFYFILLYPLKLFL